MASVDHLRECISKWLMRLDDVDKRGGANWTTLCNAVEKMNRAAADSIRAKHNILASQPIEQSCPQNDVEPDTQNTGSDEGARRRYPQRPPYTTFTPSETEGNNSSSSPNPSYVKWSQYGKIFVGLLALGLTAIILFWLL
ncbi:PREDICTED: uncharacterized protein LOC109586494 [Amphimedon queenslandica]|uniref:Death domain-containing protein n=1 Tax=Amphimedon queenslandica TaxID=400682 RepID=A0AAN0JML9_AMPQE|nr:PREDICTED: uncharacterized protein LOC109586494 [Amphimedon queenslandica]|eukprot:XP_019858249.1 PREDICTED: uncharacterized protein LOC109586494 [Amphimedon queenslandica]